jgi:chromosome segregation ATPase
VLKKPSELYPRNGVDSSSVKTPLQDSVQLKSFKDNIQKINSLSDFSETLDTYRQSVDNVNFLSKEVESIRADIKELLTTEDLDRAMMSQYVLVEQTISDVQKKVKSINESKLKDIRESVESLTNSVGNFIEEDIPKYKKLFFDGEVRRGDRYEKFKSSINESFKNSIKEVESNVEKIYDDVTSIVEGVNDKSLSNILKEVKDLGEKQESKYKKVILEGKINTDKKYQEFEESVNDRCDDLTSIIGTLNEKVSLVEGDNSDIVDTLNKKARDISSVKKSLNEIKKSFSEQTEQLEEYRKGIADEVESLKEDVVEYKDYINQVTQEVDTLRESISGQQFLNEKYQKGIEEYKKNLDEELKDIVDKVEDHQSSNEVLKERLGHKVGLIEDYKKDIDEKVKVQEFYVDEHRKDLDIKFKYQESFVENYKKEIEQKITDLHADIILNESVVRVQNSNIEQIKESIQSAIQKLNYDEIEKQNYQLANKIKYLEEVFEKFSEKELLTENVDSVPPSGTNLNENFVTVEYLQNHYRNFINRIQQQLSSLGGGGEVRLEFLDDVDRTTAKVNGKFLKYDSVSGKWVGADGGGGGGSGITTASVRDEIQGYYGYTTDFYTVGVANTTQEIGAGVTTMIQPKVAAVYQYMPTIMSGVNTNPYVGTGATIGTGQTEFSLAGLGSGASCIVRTALGFNPDDDNSNLDVQLKFTTNTATQGTGLTNFTIKKEQALIMNEGADQQYISENLFSFFVGPTLQGTTQSNAGSFNIEVVPTSEGELEVLAVTVNLVA